MQQPWANIFLPDGGGESRLGLHTDPRRPHECRGSCRPLDDCPDAQDARRTAGTGPRLNEECELSTPSRSVTSASIDCRLRVLIPGLLHQRGQHASAGDVVEV